MRETDQKTNRPADCWTNTISVPSTNSSSFNCEIYACNSSLLFAARSLTELEPSPTTLKAPFLLEASQIHANHPKKTYQTYLLTSRYQFELVYSVQKLWTTPTLTWLASNASYIPSSNYTSHDNAMPSLILWDRVDCTFIFDKLAFFE